MTPKKQKTLPPLPFPPIVGDVPSITLRPVIGAWKGDGKHKTFRYDPYKMPRTQETIQVFHTRGRFPRKPPKRIDQDKVTFEKAPQKGDTIVAFYEYKGE